MQDLNKLGSLNTQIDDVINKYNSLNLDKTPKIKQLFNQFNNFYETLKSLDKSDEEIRETLTTDPLNEIKYFDFLKLEKFVKEQKIESDKS